MWPYHPDLLETPVPRYTSYPTAADFSEIGSDDHGEALERVEGDVSLYVHIPFCESICYYCGCNTAAAGRRNRLEAYLAALHAEIDLVAARLSGGTRIVRVAFGGGSPNAISPVDFVRLVESLTLRFALDRSEFSIELDPRAMTRDWGLVISSVGITRASLGVQTFAPHCQQAIGRVQEDELIRRSVDWLRGSGISSLNFDLMYGLPGQSMQDLAASLERTCELGADRVAVFGYAHMPSLIPRQRVIEGSQLPGQAERFAMAGSAFDYMCAHGFVPIGFDHFARERDPLAIAAGNGTLRRNFQGFTDDSAPVLIGLGSSAISSFAHLLAQNEKNSGCYRMMISRGRLAAARGIARSADDHMRAKVIESLLCQRWAQIPSGLAASAGPALQRFTEYGLASQEGDRLVIEANGLPYARTIAALFDRYRANSAHRFSSAV